MKTGTGSLFEREVGERQREAMTQAVKGQVEISQARKAVTMRMV